MKLLAFIFLFFIKTFHLAGQQNPAPTTDADVSIVTISPAQNFYLDSRIVSNINGRSRLVLPVNLPEGTVKWYYSFAATDSKGEPLEWVGLAGQLTKLVDKTGIASELINRLVKPSGTAVCDIFVLDTEGVKLFESKDDKKVVYDKDFSRFNMTGGVVEVSTKNPRPSIGFSNPSIKTGINVKVEVTALVLKSKKNTQSPIEKQSTWDKTAKNELFMRMSYFFDGKKNVATDAIQLCALDSISQIYALNEFKNLLDKERDIKIGSVIQACFSKTGNQNLGIEMGEIATLKARRDALEQEGNFQEMLNVANKIEEMGYSSQPNRIKLMRANFLAGQYDKALSMADLMSRLSPEDWTINMHLAHAYLFKNQYDKAEKQYLKFKNKANTESLSRDLGRVTWEQLVATDFDFFIKNKIFNSRYVDIKKKLKIP